MIINVYRVRKDLPQYMTFNALECNRIWDIDAGIYEKISTKLVNYRSVNDLMDAVEYNIIEGIKFEESDIIEMLPDEDALNGGFRVEDKCNFIILTGLGCKQIAIEKEEVFREISFEALKEMFVI